MNDYYDHNRAIAARKKPVVSLIQERIVFKKDLVTRLEDFVIAFCLGFSLAFYTGATFGGF